MFGARGVSLRLGGVNLSDLSNLGSANAAHRVQHQLQRHQSRIGSSNSAGVGVGLASGGGLSATTPTSTSSTTGSRFQNLRKSLMEPKKKTRIVIKKTLDRTTFWSVCRALVFGTLLIALGCAMSTIGYYKEYFATEAIRTDNETITFINYSTRTHFESLSYIGPCVMGCGMFVLMLACVMTLEGRDLNTQIYSQRLSKKNSTRRSTRSRTGTDDDNLTEQTGPADEQKRLSDDTKHVDSGRNNSGAKSKDGSNNNTDDNTNVADTKGGDGGNINECFTKDDSSKYALKLQLSQHETDPNGTHNVTTTTTTTALTWSQTTGPRCEPVAETTTTASVVDEYGAFGAKYLSATSIEGIAKTSNTRILLQRFLEDQSRLVDDRMKRMRSRNKHLSHGAVAETGVDLKKQSASLEAAGSEKLVDIYRFIRSDDYPRVNYNVVAEVHHSGDAQSPITHQQQRMPIDAHVHKKVAPMASSEIFFSPMSFSPDVPLFMTSSDNGNSNNGGQFFTSGSTNGRPTSNSYLSAVYSPSPISPRQKSFSKGSSQLSVNSYTTVKSHISTASGVGLSSNSDIYFTALTGDATSSGGGSCSDFVNGNNRLDSVSSDTFWNRQPYFVTPTNKPPSNVQLFVMNRVYRPNDNNLHRTAMRRTSEGVLTVPRTAIYTDDAGVVQATDDESLSSLSYDLPINSDQKPKKHLSSTTRYETRSNV